MRVDGRAGGLGPGEPAAPEDGRHQQGEGCRALGALCRWRAPECSIGFVLQGCVLPREAPLTTSQILKFSTEFPAEFPAEFPTAEPWALEDTRALRNVPLGSFLQIDVGP